MRQLQKYHYAWLSAHPERTKDWLRFMMKAGFDIHHLDGDHDNNSSENLVLIEHRDHMRLHGMQGKGRIQMRHVLAAKQAKRKEVFLEEGKRAYEAALQVRETATYASGIWTETGRISGVGGRALLRAALWAKENNLEWPLLNRSNQTAQKAKNIRV